MFKARNDDKHEREVRFCERCGSVCDASCVEQDSRQRAFEQLLRHGRWIV